MKKITDTALLKFMQADTESSLLLRRMAILLHLLKCGESTANSMLDAGVVSMTGISFTRLLKQMVADGFISVRGGIKQKHFYKINPDLAQAMVICSDSFKSINGQVA